MESTTGRVQVRVVGDRIVARPAGPEVDVLYESSLISEIGQALYELAKQNPGKRIVVNLDGVRYASTEMIAKLVSLNSRIERAGGRLALCGLQPDVRESMRILKLLALFDLAETEEEALGGPDPELWRTTMECPKIE
jgi:anti-sigma B factor antagonist/stage II sporulation protein AA (anti-sigma F factor antagonist)